MKNLNESMVYSVQDIEQVAAKLTSLLKQCAVMTFTGPLGAGKTTLIQQICELFGVTDYVTSPTFTYLNVYETSSGLRIYHFDLYRIESLQAFLAAGFDEYLYQPNSKVLIEWPEQVLPLLDRDVCHVKLDYGKQQDERIITVTNE